MPAHCHLLCLAPGPMYVVHRRRLATAFLTVPVPLSRVWSRLGDLRVWARGSLLRLLQWLVGGWLAAG